MAHLQHVGSTDAGKQTGIIVALFRWRLELLLKNCVEIHGYSGCV